MIIAWDSWKTEKKPVRTKSIFITKAEMNKVVIMRLKPQGVLGAMTTE